MIIEEDVPGCTGTSRTTSRRVTDKVGGYKQSFTQRRIFLKDTTVG